MKKIFYAFFFFYAFAVLFPNMLTAQDDEAAVGAGLTRIAIIPFQAVISEEQSSTASCPICGSVNSSGILAKGAEKIVEEIFLDKLSEVKNLEVISRERTAAVFHRISADSLKNPLLQTIQKTGGELKADVVVVGFLYRYKERIGYDYSAERPASVTYEIHMISVNDGKTIWRGVYDKTQKSLMEDVFQASSFFKGGARWVTARQLARLGMDEIFATFLVFEKKSKP